MVKTPSTMIPLGTKAPDFTLPDTVSDTMVSFSDVKGEQGTVVVFICNHCPFVIHIQDCLLTLAKHYQAKGFGFVCISSNDVEHYPADSPDKMKTHASENGFTFPYLYDASQEVAKAYHAACTPDFFVFDADDRCVYRGQFDESRPGNEIAVTGGDLSGALDCILLGEVIDPDQKPSLGCNIKWKT